MTVSIPYSFVTSTAADAGKANQNFKTLTSYLNTRAIHTDGSRASSDPITLKNADPVNPTDAARRSYVDGKVTIASQKATYVPAGTLTTGSVVATTDFTDPGYNVYLSARASLYIAAANSPSTWDLSLFTAPSPFSTWTFWGHTRRSVSSGGIQTTLATTAPSIPAPTGWYAGTIRVRLSVAVASGGGPILTTANLPNYNWIQLWATRV